MKAIERNRSVARELVHLVLIIAIPLVLVIAGLLYDSGRRDEQNASGLALQMAVTTADRAAHYVETTRRALEAVARRPLIRAMDPAQCDPQLAAQLADLRQIYGNQIGRAHV